MITLRNIEIEARQLRNGDELEDGGIVVAVYVNDEHGNPVVGVTAIVDSGHPDWNETRMWWGNATLQVSREDYVEN